MHALTCLVTIQKYGDDVNHHTMNGCAILKLQNRMLFIKKPFQELEKRYQDTHALFFVQADAIYHRLEKISKHNLEYFSYFESISKTHEMIKHELDSKAKEQLAKLSIYVKDNQSKAFNALYQPTRITLDVFESAVKKLMMELTTIMKPEEDTKIQIAEVKELIRHLRTEYYGKINQLNLVEPQFNNLFKYVDDQINFIDQKMDAGEYDDIQQMIAKITKAVKKILSLMNDLPRICVLLAKVIPEKINNLIDSSESMNKQGYAMHHLLIKDTIHKAQDELERMQSRIAVFDILLMEVQLNSISEKLEAFYPLFEKEKEAKIIFDKDYEATYEAVNNLEKRFSKLNAGLPKVKDIYVLEHQRLAEVDIIKDLISRLNQTKRGLDTLVLAGTKQPYTLQVDKINILKKEAELGEQKLDAFTRYLSSLKTQSQEAYASVNQYFLQFKDAEKALDDLNMQILVDQYYPMLTTFYQHLKQIVDALSLLPIDMNIVQQNLNLIKQEGQTLVQRVHATIKLALETEKLLLIANKDRHRTSDNQKIIALAEQAFFEGKFEKAYAEANNLLKKMSIPTNQK
jgi:septation ring formation regulator EzrA